jgi:hypothetical protein
VTQKWAQSVLTLLSITQAILNHHLMKKPLYFIMNTDWPDEAHQLTASEKNVQHSQFIKLSHEVRTQVIIEQSQLTESSMSNIWETSYKHLLKSYKTLHTMLTSDLSVLILFYHCFDWSCFLKMCIKHHLLFNLRTCQTKFCSMIKIRQAICITCLKYIVSASA